MCKQRDTQHVHHAVSAHMYQDTMGCLWPSTIHRWSPIPKVGSEGLWFESRFGDRTADKNTGQAIDVRPPLCGSIVAGGFGGLPLSSVLLASARWIIRCGEYVSDVKISTHEGMTAQWQHMQRQFHLPFLPFFYIPRTLLLLGC
jgi:hypothetical protein